MLDNAIVWLYNFMLDNASIWLYRYIAFEVSSSNLLFKNTHVVIPIFILKWFLHLSLCSRILSGLPETHSALALHLTGCCWDDFPIFSGVLINSLIANWIKLSSWQVQTATTATRHILSSYKLSSLTQLDWLL